MKTLMTKLVPGLMCGFLAVFLIAVPATQARADHFEFSGFLTFTFDGTTHELFYEGLTAPSGHQDVVMPGYDWLGDDGNSGPVFHLSCSATLVGSQAVVNRATQRDDGVFSHPPPEFGPCSGVGDPNFGDSDFCPEVTIIDFEIVRLNTNNGNVTGCDAGDFDFPRIEVTKTGPDTAKIGDGFNYEISFENTGTLDVENCTGDDPLLGGDLGAFQPGVPRTFPFTPEAGDPNPLENTVTITCDVVGSTLFTNVSDSDSHSVALIDPAIVVTKTGDGVAKVGDSIDYTIGFTASGFAASGDGSLGTCTGNDDVFGDLGVFEAGVPRDFTFDVPAGADSPLVNIATITCEVVGFTNDASESDSHSADLIDAAVELTKVCQPDPVFVGDQIEWLITVNNTGDVNLDCELSDADADINELFSLAPTESESFSNSRTVTLDDFPTLSNTASVVCDVVGFTNQVDASDSADCEVQIPSEEICRTPGFWGTHAGEEHRRSTNLTQLVIDDGGPLEVCGATIDDTEVGSVNSAIEAMCVRIEGEQQRQLARQLTAMALNCIVSGGDADCTGTSVEGLFAECNDLCAADEVDLGSCIDRVDCFNNGGQFDETLGVCVIGSCSETGDACGDIECPLFDDEPQQCVPFEGNCQDRDLDENTEIFDGVDPFPGPAGSPRACSAATGNGIKVVPAQ